LRERVPTHFHYVSHFYLVYVRHFLSHAVVICGPFWQPLWPSAL